MEWSSNDIKSLRKERGQDQEEFGLELYDAAPESAQVSVSRLERGKMTPSAAVRRTLRRMKEGQI